jgi:hypothetical protein
MNREFFKVRIVSDAYSKPNTSYGVVFNYRIVFKGEDKDLVEAYANALNLKISKGEWAIGVFDAMVCHGGITEFGEELASGYATTGRLPLCTTPTYVNPVIANKENKEQQEEKPKYTEHFGNIPLKDEYQHEEFKPSEEQKKKRLRDW